MLRITFQNRTPLHIVLQINFSILNYNLDLFLSIIYFQGLIFSPKRAKRFNYEYRIKTSRNK